MGHPQTAKQPKIAIIGGGLGGLCAAIQLQRRLGIVSYTIFEEHEDFGGTWLVNRYPGCASDIQSHLYSFSFDLNPDWTKNYSSQPEIQAYIVRLAKKYGLYPRARFCTLVQSLEWNERESKWWLKALCKKSHLARLLKFDFFISAVGTLRVPNIPDQFNKFKGHIIHSAQWPPNLHLDHLRDKTVAIVGSGASATQIISTIAPIVKQLHSYQRSPAWIQPRMQLEFSKTIKRFFANFPIVMWLFRVFIFIYNEFHWGAFKADSLLNYFGIILTSSHMRSQLPKEENAELRKKLMPDYKFGCKRVIVSETYFPAFSLPHVHLHRQKIKTVKDNVITTLDGSSQEADILILATGFKVQNFFSPLKIKPGGKGKPDLLNDWKLNGPRTYYGIMSSRVPNAFFIHGPNTGLGHNSIIFMIECQADFILQVLQQFLKRGARVVSVRKEAEDAWMKMIVERMKGTVWGTESCGSWYQNGENGRVTALWPKNCTSYYWETRSVNLDKTMEFSF